MALIHTRIASDGHARDGFEGCFIGNDLTFKITSYSRLRENTNYSHSIGGPSAGDGAGQRVNSVNINSASYRATKITAYCSLERSVIIHKSGCELSGDRQIIIAAHTSGDNSGAIARYCACNIAVVLQLVQVVLGLTISKHLVELPGSSRYRACHAVFPDGGQAECFSRIGEGRGTHIQIRIGGDSRTLGGFNTAKTIAADVDGSGQRYL